MKMKEAAIFVVPPEIASTKTRGKNSSGAEKTSEEMLEF